MIDRCGICECPQENAFFKIPRERKIRRILFGLPQNQETTTTTTTTTAATATATTTTTAATATATATATTTTTSHVEADVNKSTPKLFGLFFSICDMDTRASSIRKKPLHCRLQMRWNDFSLKQLGLKLSFIFFFYITKPQLFISELSPDGVASIFPHLLSRGVIRTHGRVAPDWDLSDALLTELQRRGKLSFIVLVISPLCLFSADIYWS